LQFKQNQQNNAKFQRKSVRLHNRVAAGKQPVGVLPTTRKRGFESFAGFVTKQ
jgi:hypothetical protein